MDRQLSQARDAGVTLIELVVVVAILAVLAVGVSLVPTGPGRTSGIEDASRFEARLTALADRAVQGRSVLGLRIDAQRMQPVTYGAEGWRAFGPAERWSGTVSMGGRVAAGDAPEIVVLPSGQVSAFDIRFGERACRGDGWGPLQCDG